jgi:hypothetical protein
LVCLCLAVGSRRVVLLKTSCVQAMPLRSGFRSGVRCPLWLLDCSDITIIPLAKRRQTNPIYSRRPGQGGGQRLAEHCSIEVIAKRFSIGHIGNMLFVAAEIDMPVGWEELVEGEHDGWINIWQGPPLPHNIWQDTPPIGTLYCALRDDKAQLCLCGSCMHSWVIQGWVCKDVWQHRFRLGIEL